MAVDLCGWVFVYAFLSKAILVTSYLEIKVGNVRVLRKHPKLRSCADEILKQNAYVGGRISNQTGECEGLSHSWGRNQTIENGYGYVKKIHVHEDFEPPAEVDEMAWKIPGVLETGAKVDVHLTLPKIEWACFIELTEALTGTSGPKFYIGIYQQQVTSTEVDKHGEDRGDVWKYMPRQFSQSARCKVSFVAKRNSLQILVDDEVVQTENLKNVRVRYLRQVLVNSRIFMDRRDPPDLVLHRFEFTEP